jgi:hypothetical protein
VSVGPDSIDSVSRTGYWTARVILTVFLSMNAASSGDLRPGFPLGRLEAPGLIEA